MNNDYRNTCQVFTPKNIVTQLLDWCEYKEDLYKKKVMENSCGEGNILIQVVERYIKDCLSKNYPLNDIKNGLENDIYGIEYDKEKYDKCIENLNNECKKYNIYNVNWENIINSDTLTEQINTKFDYIVGNPPYIKYKTLELNDREYIRENFETCKKGKFDYCYAFIEKSIKSLSDSGKMAYLIPSSIFKNVFANELREFIKPYINQIYDYTSQKLFDKTTNDKHSKRLTSSAIMILSKNNNSNLLVYKDVTNNNTIVVDKSELEKKWIFDNSEKKNKKKKCKFSDYFYASNCIATLYNKAYVISNYKEDRKYIYINDIEKVEKDVIKDTISPKYFRKNIRQKLIFPYYYKNGELQRYSKEEFENKFTGACNYLRNNYLESLKKRKADKNAQWFEYGRSQALKNSNKKKLLLSTVITNNVNVKLLDENTIPYSGIYIVSTSKRSLEEAKEILESNEFFEYVKKIGIHASGESLRITAKDINNYMFYKKEN